MWDFFFFDCIIAMAASSRWRSLSKVYWMKLLFLLYLFPSDPENSSRRRAEHAPRHTCTLDERQKYHSVRFSKSVRRSRPLPAPRSLPPSSSTHLCSVQLSGSCFTYLCRLPFPPPTISGLDPSIATLSKSLILIEASDYPTTARTPQICRLSLNTRTRSYISKMRQISHQFNSFNSSWRKGRTKRRWILCVGF